MKNAKLLIFSIAVLFSVSFLVNELKADDKWEIVSVSGPSSCKLNAKDLTFKVKLKNTGNAISTGTKVIVRVVITHDGNNLGGDELEFAPGMGSITNIGIGKTTTLSVLCTNENFRQFTGAKGDKSISVTVSLAGDAGVTKIFSVKVK